jgi:hypothetical protein
MNKNFLFLFKSCLDELYNTIEETLNTFVLRILQEKGQVIKSLTLKPIFTVVSSTVYHMGNFILL